MTEPTASRKHLPRWRRFRHPQAGFAGSPRVLGTQSNREVLTFIEGDVAVDPHWQPGHGHRLRPYARAPRCQPAARC